MYNLRLWVIQFQWSGASDGNGSTKSEMALGRDLLSRCLAGDGRCRWNVAAVGEYSWMECDLEFEASLCCTYTSRSIFFIANGSVETIKYSQRKNIRRRVYG